jgi:hypothetical protein
MERVEPWTRRSSETPTPRSARHVRLEEALEPFQLESHDLHVLLESISLMGTIDPELSEWIGADRMTLQEAAAAPLRRHVVGAIPEEGEAPSYFAETVLLPSGRVMQLQRRYPGADELNAHLARQEALPEPSLWIREIEGLGPRPPNLDAVDAATVEDIGD